MQIQLKSIFLERQDSFFTIKELYGDIYQDKSQLSNVFVGAMASTAYFNSILNSELSEEDKQDEWYAEQKEKEKEALLEILDTKNLFTGKLSKELTEMKEKYPDNKFLQKLSSYAGSVEAILTDGEKENTVKESNIKLLDKVKLKDNLLDDVKSDLNNLMTSGLNERLFVKKLFWNEIIRTGSQINVPGSYINLFPQEFQTEYSEKLNDVLNIFNYGNKVVRTGSKEFFANGETFNTEQEASDFIKDNEISIEGSISTALGENYKNVLDTILNKLALQAIKDSANSNISKSKAIKLGIGEAKNNYKFRSGFVKAVQNNYKIDDPTKLKEASLVHIEKVFGIKINREALAKDRVKQLFINDPRYVTTTNDKITVKVNPEQFGLNYQTADVIGGRVKFEKELDPETGEAFTTMKMQYPTLFSVGNEYYQLTSVDNKPITEAKDVILPNNTGNEATYVKVNKTMLDSTSNGIAVSNENANEYTSYAEQSRKIKIEKTALEQTVVDPGTQPAQQSSAIKYFEGNITPEPNTVFVFGSNPIGVNGNPARGTGGAALVANQQFGVKQGEKMINKLSDSGKAFGLVTVTGPGKKRSVSPSKITEGVKELYKTALANPNKQFKVAYRNTTQRSLNGYTGLEMIEMFNAAGTIPSNVVFSKEWFDTGKLNTATKLSSTVQLQTEIKIPYKYQGKTQNYTIKGTQIFNKDGKEVFASKSKDRLKIFANFAILQGRAEVVEITQKENNVEVNKTYVVNNKNQVMSTVTGNEIKAKDIVTKAIAAADVIRARKAEGNPNNVNKPDQEDIDNCMG